MFAEEEEGNIYTRFSNPNTDEFIQKLCALEGAEDGIATASGMAAVYLSLNALLRPGDHVLSSRQLFGTTHLLFTQVLSKWGVSHTYVDMKDQQEWKDNLLPTTTGDLYGDAFKSGYGPGGPEMAGKICRQK